MSNEDLPSRAFEQAADGPDQAAAHDAGTSADPSLERPAATERNPRTTDSTGPPRGDAGRGDAELTGIPAAGGGGTGPEPSTGPVYRVAPPAAAGGWEERPSGALSARSSWANPASYPTGSYPGASATGSYPTGSYPTGSYPTGGYPPGSSGAQYPGSPTSTFSPFRPTGSDPDGILPYAAGGGTSGGNSAGQSAGGGVGTLTKPPNGQRKKGVLAGATVLVLALGVGFGGGVLGAEVASGRSSPVADASLTQTSASAPVSDTQGRSTASVPSVAAKLLPSVVSILSVSSTEEGEGSGVILSDDGLIVTNNHVVAGATTLTVRFNDGTSASANIIGTDATDDLAVIKAKGVSGLTKATLGSSANLQVGQPVVAVGSPLGLSASVTSGIVSALNRPVRTAANSQGQQGQSQSTSQDTVLNAIQTDASINPGNSGGPLVDMSGQVIGINSAIASLSSGSSTTQSGSIGVGFAIPIDQVRRIAQEIINTGKASHAVLGASVSDDSATSRGGITGMSNGAKIASVTAGGGAAKAGIQAGDVVTKIGSQTVESADALIAAIRSQNPGGQVAITFLRDSQSRTVTVTLGSATSN